MTRTTRVVPAILTDDPVTLAEMVRQSAQFTDYAQIDIMDGQFVTTRSIGWTDLAALAMKLEWEAHLMVRQPETCLDGFRQAGAKRIIFHYEATGTHREVITRARGLGLEVGLAVNPETELDAFKHLVGLLDSVLFMSVHPGAYGAKFIPEVLEKVSRFRKGYPKIELGIDGGIKENNIAAAAHSGADAIYVGSAIFLQPQPAASFRRLTALARKAR